MNDLMSNVLLGLSAFAGGVLCGSAVIGPKLYAALTGTLSQMSHDLNPRRDAPRV